MRIHYAGALVVRRGKIVTSISPGYAACCSGDRAIAVRKRGNHTYVRMGVTCQRCLDMIEKTVAAHGVAA